MISTEVATTLKPLPHHMYGSSAVSDENQPWPDLDSILISANECADTAAQKVQMTGFRDGSIEAVQASRGSLPSGLGTLTTATCHVTLPTSKQTTNGKAADTKNGKECRSVRKVEAVGRCSQAKTVTTIGRANQRVFKGHTMQHPRPKSATGLTIIVSSTRARYFFLPSHSEAHI